MPLPLTAGNNSELATWVNRLQNRYKYRDRGIDMNLLRVIKAYYYATISFVDYQIGRILGALEETGQLDDTLIMFTSDHGEHLGDFGCFGKRSMHDASVRVPMLIRYPSRFPAGQQCSVSTSLCDVFPTILGASGISPKGLCLDGRDLIEIAREPDPARTVYSQFKSKDKAIYMAVNACWKYVYSAGDRAEFFFDRQTDPAETDNLATATELNDAGKELKQNLLRYLESCGMTEAYVEQNESLEWREYPRFDESYLNDPDANLLVQDYTSYPMNLPGYAKAEPEHPDRDATR